VGPSLRPGHPGRRRAVRPDRTRRAAGPVQRPPAPMDARHGVLRAACLALLAEQGTVLGVAPAVVRLQRLPERRICHPERGDPRPRPRYGKRATVAGWVGMPIALGLVLGTVLVVDVPRPGIWSAATSRSRSDGGAGPAVVLKKVQSGPPLALPGPRGLFSWRRVASSYCSARAPTRFRLGLADPLPGRLAIAWDAVPAVLPRDAVALRAAVPRPDRRGRACSS